MVWFMRRFPLCASLGSPMHPASQQMMGDGKGMRPSEAVRMLPRQHQRRLGTVEPARVFEFGAIDCYVLAGGARGASDHQRRRIRPGLRHVIIHIGTADAGLLENLAA